MTNEEIAEHLSWICYKPNTNRRDMYAVQLFVEKLVLPEGVTSYPRNIMEEKIIELLERNE